MRGATRFFDLLDAATVPGLVPSLGTLVLIVAISTLADRECDLCLCQPGPRRSHGPSLEEILHGIHRSEMGSRSRENAHLRLP